MKLAVLPCMIAVALSISGCTFSEINKMQKKAQEALSQPMSRERIEKQLRKTGNTEFEFFGFIFFYFFLV